MNHPDPAHPGNRGDKPAAARASLGPSLEDLMARIRLELTDGAEDISQTARASDEAAAERAAAVGPGATALSVDEIMERVRRELKRRRGGASDPATASSTALPAEDRLPRWQPSAAPLPVQPTYVLADMLRPSDDDFVDTAFRILLRRPASAHEKAHYLNALRSSGMGKVEILGTIRFSDEGMQHGVHVDGLLIPYKLHVWRRIPILGGFLAMGIALFRLPRLFAHLQKLEAASAQESQQVGRALNDLAQAAETRQAHLDDRLDTLAGLQRRVQAQMDDRFDTLAGLQQRVQAQLSEQMPALANTVDHLRQQLAAQASLSAQIEARLEQLKHRETAMMARLESVRAEQAGAHAQLESQLGTELSAMAKIIADGTGVHRTIHDIERRLMALSDRMSQHAAGLPTIAPPGPGEGRTSPGFLDAHYVSFEDTFRGTREDIKTRAGHYLATFRNAGVEAGDGLILDLGCGRGEWLEVLSENGYACRGVDMNSVMVSEAQALGFDVVERDAVAYLRSLGSESVSAVTSMHLVEHLPYEVLVRLIDEALRVLRPGGVLILETPNPENLTVGSYWFYMDPTHRNPIPPPLLQWVVEARGFEHAAVDRLTLNRGVFDIQPVGEDVAGASQINKIVDLLIAAPDYAIVARKPYPEAAHGQGT